MYSIITASNKLHRNSFSFKKHIANDQTIILENTVSSTFYHVQFCPVMSCYFNKFVCLNAKHVLISLQQFCTNFRKVSISFEH